MTAPAPLQSDPDADLVARAKSGDFPAFDALVTRHERSVYTLAMRIVRNIQDAEEIVQETFLSVLEHLSDFAGQSLFRTWLLRIATNHALKLLRKRRTSSTVSLDNDPDSQPLPHPDFIAPWRNDPADLAQQHETRKLLDDALDALDEKYRLVFLLRDVQDLSTEETAEALGITPANVKIRLLRARLMLRERLTRTLGDESARMVAPEHSHDFPVTAAPSVGSKGEAQP